MSYKTINNFLDKDHFAKLQATIFNLEFPWRRREDMNYTSNNRIYFTHCFYNNMEENSPHFKSIIKPILEKLNGIAPIEVRSNMFISKLFTKSEFHMDYKVKAKTAILYLNDCDGGTEIKVNNKIKFIQAKANKILIFDTSVLHRAVSSVETPIRYIINLNYYEG